MINYYLSYNYYVEVLCVNKEEKEFKCNGLCHLSQQLEQKTSSSESIPTEPKAPSIPFDVYFFSSMNYQVFNIEFNTKIEFYFILKSLSLGLINLVFRPPIL